MLFLSLQIHRARSSSLPSRDQQFRPGRSSAAVDFLKKEGLNFEHKKYPDHHHFSASEIKQLREKEIILTTEKDFMRLQSRLEKFAIYYLPIKTLILKKQEPFLKEFIINEIEYFGLDD